MKRLICMSIALLLIAWCAFAAAQEITESDITTPRAGVAVAAPQDAQTGGTVPMYEKPDTNSCVLMSYYSGAQMEVLSILGDMAQVQCGTEGASVMGYMRAQDLLYGAQAMREVPVYTLGLDFEQALSVHSYCDEHAPVIGEAMTAFTQDAVGMNADNWAQLNERTLWLDIHGFVQLREDAARREYRELDMWEVIPLENELTAEQAIERAIEWILLCPPEHERVIGKLPDGMRTREGLEALNANVMLTYLSGSDQARWTVYLEDLQDDQRNVHVTLSAEGELIMVERAVG